MVGFEPPTSGLGCIGRCCQWLLYTFNVLFLFSGIAAIGIGVWAVLDETSVRVVTLTNSEMYIKAALVLISAGAASIFISFFGCCAARYENQCLIATYAVLLLVLFVIEFASGVLALAYYVQIETFANMEMRDAVVIKYGQANQIDTTDAYNYMQELFDCCGFNGTSHDAAQLYQISAWFENSEIQVPPSCCKRDEDGEPINEEKCLDQLEHDMSFVNNVGCSSAVISQGARFTTVLAGVGIGLSIMQLIGLVLTFCLFRRL